MTIADQLFYHWTVELLSLVYNKPTICPSEYGMARRSDLFVHQTMELLEGLNTLDPALDYKRQTILFIGMWNYSHLSIMNQLFVHWTLE